MSSGNVERRLLPLELGELRVVPAAGVDGGGGEERIRGYFARFDTWSPVYGNFRERIAPSFLEGVLEGADIRCLWNHNADFPIGRTVSGTLEVGVDERGGWYAVRPPSSELVRGMVLDPIARGDVSGSSFAFTVREDAWAEGEDGIMERTLLRAGEILEVSPVVFPFYPDTSSSLRSLEAWRAAGLAVVDLAGTGSAPPRVTEPGSEALRRARLRQRRAELELAAGGE